MIDLHAHLLPGLDDGSISYEQSLEYLEELRLQGCGTVVCTTHISHLYNNSENAIRTVFNTLAKTCEENSLDIHLCCGAEYSSELLLEKVMEDAPIVYLNGAPENRRKYVLLELPCSDIADRWFEKLAEKLMRKGIGIVFAHPERMRIWEKYHPLFARPENLLALTSSSVLGEAGRGVRDTTFAMLERYNRKVVICSDVHPALERRPKFPALVAHLTKRYPPVEVDRWIRRLPEKILLGE